MATPSFSAPLFAGVPSGGTIIGAAVTDLIVTSHPAALAFTVANGAVAYVFNGNIAAGVSPWVEAHSLVETRSTTIPLTILPPAGLIPVAGATFFVTGDSNGVRWADSIAKAIADGGYDAFAYGDTGNPSGTGVGGSQSFPANNGLADPVRMAREKAAITAHVQQGGIAYSALGMWTNDYFSPADSIKYTAIWHNEVVRGGGSSALLLRGAMPSRQDPSRAADMRTRNDLARQYALDNADDVIFVDIFDLLFDPNTGIGKTEYYGDELHPNQAGVEACAPFIYPGLDRLCTKVV